MKLLPFFDKWAEDRPRTPEQWVNGLLEWIFGKTPRGERKVWLHVQNLNEDHRGKVKGSMLWEGRGWLHFPGPGRSGRLGALHFDWCLRSRFCSVAFSVEDSDNDVKLHVALPPVSLWWGLEGVFPVKDRRDLSVSIHDWCLWWNVWRDDFSWDRSVPRWRSGNWDIRKTFLGDTTYRSELLHERDLVIPMPEGGYPAHVKLTKDTWSRPRWFTQTVFRAKVDMKVPIPHEGKGENEWDCGKDALHGSCFPAKTYDEAVAHVVGTVLRARRKYDGDIAAVYPPPKVA